MNAGHLSPYLLLAVLAGYIGVLVAAGHWAERQGRLGRDPTNRSLFYTLGLTVYCTSWTFYGSVGSAANGGMVYSAIYLGPTIVMIVSWGVVRRMISLRGRYHFSSVVDFITQRHGQSVGMGAFITLVLLLGMVPYIALQIRALLESFTLVTGLYHNASTIGAGHFADESMIVLIGVMTCLFGLRRVDTRERQHGLMAVLAIESFVKLASFLAIGIFVVWGIFDGFGDLYTRLTEHLELKRRLIDAPLAPSAYLTWMSYLVLAMAAILFLPHVFHVMVVENHDERHLTTAMWGFPLYLLTISFFVLPIAAAGLLLGYPANKADWLVISLPFDHGSPALTVLSFLGGFSAAVGMIMVACTTMAIAFSNHVVLPLIDRGIAGVRLRGALRPIRWIVVFVMLWAAYLFERGLGDSYLLIQMGLISFATVLQFVPAGLGGLFWARGNRVGAWWGLGLGWAVWAYTLLLPALTRSGLADARWLAEGPFGIELLRPEALLGLDLVSPYANAVFWSLLVNGLAYVLGSLLAEPGESEATIAGHYLGTLDQPGARRGTTHESCVVERKTVLAQIDALFSHYLPKDEAAIAVADLRQRYGDGGTKLLSGPDYLGLTGRVERVLSGTIGAAMARKGVAEFLRLSDEEALALQSTLGHELATLRISPQQLREQVDYYRSLEEINRAHAAEMEEKIRALEEAARAREHADAARRESETRFRSLADNAPVMVWTVDADGTRYFNQAWHRFTGDEDDATIDWAAHVHPEDHDGACLLLDVALAEHHGVEQELRLRRVDGEYRYVRVNIVPRHADDGVYAGLVGTAVDISDLIAAELTLRRSNEELEALVGNRTQSLVETLAERNRAESELRDRYAELSKLNRRLEEAQNQLLQSEKMASIGQLAAGIAHEINNPVGFVNSNLGTLKQYSQQLLGLIATYQAAEGDIDDAGIRQELDRIKQSLDLEFVKEDLPALIKESEDGLLRVKKIVQDLKDFSHVNESDWLFADLNAGLDSTLNVVWNEVKYKATVDKQYGEIPEVECLAAQLNQVFMNLIVNAVQALDESRGMGKITLSTGREGDEVWVEVEDNGRGMSAEVQKRIFEPFFTTKPVGKGTGLGLSLSYNIVQKHHGHIDLHSEPGVGTRFRVWVPIRHVGEAPAGSNAGSGAR